MKLVVINPNSTASMTDKILASARAVAAPGTDVEGRTAHGAPASIEGHFDEVMSAAHLLREVQQAQAEGAGAGDVVLPVTQAKIAELAGSSRESASRFLANLERAGVITQGRGRVTVHDPEALKRYIF